MNTVTISWVSDDDDERVDFEVDGAPVLTADREIYGTAGMADFVTLATELAQRLGATVETAGTPNL